MGKKNNNLKRIAHFKSISYRFNGMIQMQWLKMGLICLFNNSNTQTETQFDSGHIYIQLLTFFEKQHNNQQSTINGTLQSFCYWNRIDENWKLFSRITNNNIECWALSILERFSRTISNRYMSPWNKPPYLSTECHEQNTYNRLGSH